MDNPTVATPRSSVPAWAREHLPNKITPPQRKFILGLIEEREHGLPDGKLDELFKMLRISEDPEELGMTKATATKTIEWLLKKKKKPRTTGRLALPAGRYAIENNEGELRFYQCWQSRDGKAKRIYVQHSDETSKLPVNAQLVIAEKILAAGVRECAIRYGMEIGSCSNCGRTLTNRISRELGIGPICGGRMFGDDWSDEVKTKRDEILARGEDPDEELS
jgi:hypothetical protein